MIIWHADMRRFQYLCQTFARFATATFNELPVIDVAPLVAAPGTISSAERHRVGEQLHHACKDVGFFYIRNGMDGAVADDVRLQARRWFALPEATKKEILLSPESHYRGYQPLGVNVTQGARQVLKNHLNRPYLGMVLSQRRFAKPRTYHSL